VIEFCPQFTYDAIRIFPNNKVTKLIPWNGNQCSHCYQDNLRLHHTQGCLICANCGTVIRDRMTLSELDIRGQDVSTISTRLPRNHSDNRSKRANHFKYWILRLQGKETHSVTRVHLEQLKNHLRTRGQLSISSIKVALRQLKMQRFYNNVFYIFNALTRIPLPKFTPEQEAQLLLMFKAIQSPFSEHRGRRVNMLSYLYLIRKFSEILGWEEFAETLEQLKSREKLKAQDRIWKEICHDVGYPFYSSV